MKKSFAIGIVKGQEKYTRGLGFGFENGARSKKVQVRCINTGEIFESVSKAAIYAGMQCSGNISEVCNGNKPYAGKDKITKQPLKWEYVLEDETLLVEVD